MTQQDNHLSSTRKPDKKENIFSRNPEYKSSEDTAARPFNTSRERQVLIVLVTGVLLVLITLTFSFCVIKQPLSVAPEEPQATGPYGILQERVDEAFSSGEESDIPDTASPAGHQTMPDAPWQDNPPAEPPATQTQEAPLILPETMPTPAPLGQGY